MLIHLWVHPLIHVFWDPFESKLQSSVHFLPPLPSTSVYISLTRVQYWFKGFFFLRWIDIPWNAPILSAHLLDFNKFITCISQICVKIEVFISTSESALIPLPSSTLSCPPFGKICTPQRFCHITLFFSLNTCVGSHMQILINLLFFFKNCSSLEIVYAMDVLWFIVYDHFPLSVWAFVVV